MRINNEEINASQFAYGGCHKIYIIEDEEDLARAIEIGYHIHPISEIEKVYKDSCELKFINNWKLNKTYVAQFENAIFSDK